MKKILLLLSFLAIVAVAFSQRPTGFPTQTSKGWHRFGYPQADSAFIPAIRDTSWTPRFFGTTVRFPRPGIDTTYWWWDNTRWRQEISGGIPDSTTLIVVSPLQASQPSSSTYVLELDTTIVHTTDYNNGQYYPLNENPWNYLTTLTGVVTNIYRVPGVDTIYWEKDGVINALLDSTGDVGPPVDGISHSSYFVGVPVITWNGTGFEYTVSVPDYFINGEFFPAKSQVVTLADPNITYNRYDAFVADTLNNIDVVQGSATASPETPPIDGLSQLLISYKYMQTGTTEPAISRNIVYAEGNEWDTVASVTFPPSALDWQSTVDQHSGLYSVRLNGTIGREDIRFDYSTMITAADMTSLSFWVKAPATNTFVGSKFIWVILYNNATAVGGFWQVKNGSYGMTATTAWQKISIPMTFTGVTFNRLAFAFPGSVSGAIYIDDVEFQDNGNVVTTNKYFTQVAGDAGPTVIAQNNNAKVYIKGTGGISTLAVVDTIRIDGSGISVSGAAGGDLAGTYPNPTFRPFAGLSVLARSVNTSGVPTDVALAPNTLLGTNGATLGGLNPDSSYLSSSGNGFHSRDYNDLRYQGVLPTGTTGGFAYWNGSTWVYLAPGAANQHLTGGASPAWVDTSAGGGGTPGGGQYSVQYNRNGAFAGNSTLVYDTTTRYFGIGITAPTSYLHVVGDSGLPVMSAELLSASGWTSTNWTGSWAAGWSHTTGNTTALTNTLVATTSAGYRIVFTVTGRTAGTFTVTYGGVTSQALSATGYWSMTATSAGTLSIAPSSTFDGTIVISIKRNTSASTPYVQFVNANSGNIQFRTSGNASNNANTFIGLNAGARTIVSSTGINTGVGNTGIGVNSLSVNFSGASNTAVGSNSLAANVADGNVAVGTNALSANTTGTNNAALGVQALTGNTTSSNNTAFGGNALFSSNGGSNTGIGTNALFLLASGAGNVAVGVQAGYLKASGAGNTASGNSTYLGNSTRSSTYVTSVTNETVLGYSAIGIGDNTVVLGNTSVVTTSLRGSIGIGTDAPVASAKVEMVSTTQGLLIPRGTTSQNIAISSPALSLLTYNTSKLAISVNQNGSTTTWGQLYPALDTVATDADFTMPAYTSFVNLPTISNNRTITLPVATDYENKSIILKVANSAGFAWSVAVAIKDKTDADVTALTNDTVYTLYSDGTFWHITSLY